MISSRWDRILGGGGKNANTKTRPWTLDDFVVRAGKNTDVVLGTILLTALTSPTAAVVAALLGTLYASRGSNKPVFGMSRDDYLRLKDIVYKSITAHNDGIRRRLIDYGIKPLDADILLHRTAYDNYLDGLIANYA